MDFAYVLFFLLACCGATQIIIDGSILNKFRELVNKLCDRFKIEFIKELLSCYMCCATHVGFVIGLIMQPLGDKLHWGWQTLLCGFVSSCFTVFLVSLLKKIWGDEE